MSDQVEIVATEDAPSHTDGVEMDAAFSSLAETPETVVESASQSGPVTEERAEVAGAEVAEVVEATEDEDEPLVDGPVGEILDDSNDTPEAAAVESTSAAAKSAADGGKSNVRILAVGQQVMGAVKRIADFGAFVDIGVGRDGLIHISELSVRRVGKVTDVLAEGQEVTAWIKKLDRDRNRISLTLIDPNTKTIRDLNKDDLVQGTVTRILPYGAFVDIGIGRDALLHVREMGVGYVAKPEDVVKVGEQIEARIIELSRRRGRVDLSLKGLREEPEPTPAPQPEAQLSQTQKFQERSANSRRRPEPEPEPEPEDDEDFEGEDVLSPMELAFKRAMEAEGMELNISRKKQNKRNRRERNRSLQDEIISRTLTSGRK
jgi:predicted RNA-binding protein with RPS1 domain